MTPSGARDATSDPQLLTIVRRLVECFESSAPDRRANDCEWVLTVSDPRSSYLAKAKEGNLQTLQTFGLDQCELREFQLQLGVANLSRK